MDLERESRKNLDPRLWPSPTRDTRVTPILDSRDHRVRCARIRVLRGRGAHLLAVGLVATIALGACNSGGDERPSAERHPNRESTSTTSAVTTTTTTTTTVITAPGTESAADLLARAAPAAVLDGPGPASATGLHSDVACAPSGPAVGIVHLSWVGSGAGEQRIALSTRKEGLGGGGFGVSEPLAADRGAFELVAPQPGGIYFWRVLTAVEGGLAPSAIESFEGPTCILDSPG
jgi:hypothetical protein